ncbi:coil containing protein [Vibrio phage 1.240.O._10N.261.52.F8]|nr:coil containing protein [Vibrio phage 1.240.O._10N.261.52.F8]
MAKLNVTVEESGIDQTDRKLKKLGVTGSKTEKQTQKATSAMKDFGKNAGAAIAAVDGPLGGVSSRLSSITTVLTSGTAALTAFAVAAAAGATSLYQGMKALDEYEVGLRRTEAILRATGEAAGFTAEQLREQADALGRATLTSTQEVQKAQAQLLTFNRVAGETFTRAIGLSQDLSETGFGSITSSAVQLGKALQDPVKGVSALSRVGVSFTQSQQDLIKSLVESNQLLEAQTIILDALESQVGGTGVAVAVDTFAGSWDSLTDAVEKFNVQIAQSSGLSSAFRAVINQTTQDIDYLTAKMDENSRVTFDGLVKQRMELKATLKELEGNAGIFGPSTGAVNRVKAQLQEVEAEMVRIQDFEKSRQEAITAAQEKSREEQKRLDKIASDARLAIIDEENRKKSEKNAAIANIEAQKADQANADNMASLRARHEEETAMWEAHFTGINTIEAEKNKERIEQERENMLLMNSVIQDTGNALSSSISSSISGIIKGTTDAREALLSMVTAVTDSIISAGVDILVQKFVTDNIVKAMNIQATTADVSRGVSMAALNAFASTAAIPVVGPAAAPAAAAAAASAATALGAPAIAAAGARFQGGQVSAGNMYNWQERGGEAFIPKVDGTVLNKNDTKAMLNGGGGTTVNIYNQASGVSVQAEQNAEGGTDIYVTKEEFSGLMAAYGSDPDSDFNRTQDSLYSRPRS